MNNPLFRITNLTCAYKRGKNVLKIDQLEIPRNRFIVLIGKSGSGKSTFLETLGLMNNTIKNGEILFYPTPDSESISLKEQWEEQHRSEIARIRRDYFSFIFQNTNLMQNFTAHENACLSQMIHGTSLKVAMDTVKANMQTMGLEEVDEEQKASELSIGQKQRLAFVRAITPVFTVLFGDEPTGNLDEFNSKELMLKLRHNISKYNRSAIIVSHNIALSAKYADLLIVLNKSEDKDSCATITENHIFRKSETNDSWLDCNNQPVNDVVSEIQEQLTAGSIQKAVQI